MPYAPALSSGSRVATYARANDASNARKRTSTPTTDETTRACFVPGAPIHGRPPALEFAPVGARRRRPAYRYEIKPPLQRAHPTMRRVR